MADKEKLTPQQEHAEPTKETKEAQAAPDPARDEAKTPADDILKTEIIKDTDIDFDIETGEITEETRKKMQEAINYYFEILSQTTKRNAAIPKFGELYRNTQAYKNFEFNYEQRLKATKKSAENTAIKMLNRDNEKRQKALQEMGETIKTDADFIDAMQTIKENSKKLVDTIIKVTGALFSDSMKAMFTDALKDIAQIIKEELPPIKEFLQDYKKHEELLKKELEKPEYNGMTIEKISKEYELADIIELYNNPDSFLSKAFEAARAEKRAQEIAEQQASRNNRRALKENAEKQNAIMKLKGGNLYMFSSEELQHAFDPGRICKMGELSKEYINKDTGALTITPEKSLANPKASEISINAFTLLTTLMANSVENIRENAIKDFLKNGEITFYVHGVLKEIATEPRALLDNQLNIDRKTAGVIYLEELFKPLEEYLGTMPNGSRWKILNYKGYDAEADTMTVETPYIFKLWEQTQGAYFERKQRIEDARKEGKKPKKADYKPLEINAFFKKKAHTENPTTLEIAIYITTAILQAGGKKGTTKTTKLSFRKIIKECPRLNESLEAILNDPNKKQSNGKPANITALYNTELRKIKTAINIIFDPNKCDFLEKYDILSITPTKTNKKTGRPELIPPIKSKLDDNIVINWRKKNDENEQNDN